MYKYRKIYKRYGLICKSMRTFQHIKIIVVIVDVKFVDIIIHRFQNPNTKTLDWNVTEYIRHSYSECYACTLLWNCCLSINLLVRDRFCM